MLCVPFVLVYVGTNVLVVKDICPGRDGRRDRICSVEMCLIQQNMIKIRTKYEKADSQSW